MDIFWFYLIRIPKMFDLMMKYIEKRAPGAVASFFCRFRYIDDLLKDIITAKEIESVVNLGAGMDPRAYYIPGIESIRYFEVDHPKVIKRKMKKINKVLGKLPDHVVYVPMDFEKQSLDTELTTAGYDLSGKTLFISEGVTQYLSEEANDNALKYVARAASGSKIAFTYVLKSFIDGENIHDGIKYLYNTMVKKQKIFIFGFDPEDISDYLSNYSLSLIEDVGSNEYQERYEILENLGLEVYEVERMVLAEVKR
jgi:methyltransferase (TIGR00027 family)